MTVEVFKLHMSRIKGMWPKGMPQAREEMIFNALKTMPDHWMERMTNEFIANSKTCPVLKDFLEKVNEYTKADSLAGGRVSGDNVFEIFSSAARYAKNPEFVSECKSLLTKKAKGEISLEEFHRGCDLLDQAAALLTKGVCKYCNNDGYVYENRCLERCTCKYGQARPELAYGPTDRDGKRAEHKVPLINRAKRNAR